MNLDEEKKLIEKAQKDPDSFAVLYDHHYTAIYSYCLRRVGNISIAEDICSESFLKAFKNLPYYKWKNIPFSAWLYRIASNEVKMFYRRKRYKPELLEELYIPLSTTSEDEKSDSLDEKIEKILFELRKLDLKYQEVVTLRYFQKLSIRDISAITGKKEGTIKSLISRGLEKIRNSI